MTTNGLSAGEAPANMVTQAQERLRSSKPSLYTLLREIMDLLVFKLTLTPLLLAAASLAVRRWGEAIGGFLVGLPLTSGPVSVFLTLEHGPAFAAQAASGSLIATAAQAAFCVAYCRLAKRGSVLALAAASATFAVVAGFLQWSALPENALFLIAVLAILLALNVIRNRAAGTSRLDAPWWDLPLRMALITTLVVGVTLIAPYVGPEASGVLASFPFMGIILALFAHRLIGHTAAQQVLRGMVASMLGFAAFFHVLSLTLTRLSVVEAYSAAIVCTLAIQAVSLYRLRVPVAVPAK
jgi:hypothetical protein